ncbi:CocE/NonD family hydrolase [Nocardioides sp. ChNu-99]|uniref:CocE/NonD family hydrolase n=1 Tax=Nocardioides sp. ChNu-99 TaxID=2839897 RepID=UPI00240726B7|nr:CocE/NonD family hydrolase [Nocardioides sp. ChNu-99]MDF9715883.1 CocE/NonD family hydrolase [Nocardioides sp. ChNu-99]
MSRAPRPPHRWGAYAVSLAVALTVTVAPAATATPAGPVGTTATPATSATTAAPAAASTTLPSGWTPRGEDHPGTVTQRDLEIPVSDGTVLRGDLVLPADADGTAVPGRFPVVVTITAYNKSASGASDLAGSGADYLVKRGYAQLTVDARGTGGSPGTWGAFSARENQDASEIVAWATSPDRPWSNGSAAMRGPSYMGINQIFAAAGKPAGLKALFPQVPAADVYRDVVASGGQLDVGFIPLWMGLVTGTGVIPPAYGATDPAAALTTVFSHLTAAATFSAPLLLGSLLGGDTAYDGPFYRERSPIEVIDQVDVPTFLVGGQYDLFQRGTPLLFEDLRSRGVPTKMILGPWNHLEGSSGEGVADAGYGTLDELQLRWFDHHVRGIPDPGLDTDIAPLTYYEQNADTWRQAQDWIGDNLDATTFRLSGGATAGGLANGTLTTGDAAPGTAVVPPVPVAGLCSRSTDQWTAGLPSQVLADLPCFSDNRANDLAGVVWDTEPLTEPLRFQGPLNARLHTSTPAGDGMLSVAVSSVAPDGTVHRITGGWQVISHRVLDESRSRYLDGELIQAHHPFTAEAKQRAGAGEVVPVDVEIFPTGAQVPAGHRLRLAVQAFDVPHLLPVLPDLVPTLVPMTIHTSAEHPSVLTVPEVEPFATSTYVRLAEASTPAGAGTTARVAVGTTGFGAPQGSVRVTVDGRPVADVPLVGGRADVPLPAGTAAGTHVVRASYAGSEVAAPSERSATWTVRPAVSPAQQATRTYVRLDANPTLRGGVNRVRFAVARADGSPATGRVRVLLDGVRLRDVALVDGYGTLGLPGQQRTGAHAVQVTYFGDARGQASVGRATWTVRPR